MLRFISVISIVGAFTLLGTPSAHADLCQYYVDGLRGTGSMVPCDTAPTELYYQCGTKNGEAMWCISTGGERQTKAKKNNNSTAIVVGVGVGLAVLAVAWYFFKKEPSKNNPGQVSLATF